MRLHYDLVNGLPYSIALEFCVHRYEFFTCNFLTLESYLPTARTGLNSSFCSSAENICNYLPKDVWRQFVQFQI
jgi:hypothetical protein